MIRISALLALLLVVSNWSGAQDPPRHLYLANDTHTDLMWNGDEEDWYRYSLDMARFYLKLGEETRDNPPEARSKWNYDATWTLYMMEKREPEEFFHRIIAQIKNRQASVPYNFTLPVYGASTMESVLRSLYFGGHLERKYGIDIPLAVSQENATLPLGLASLWAGSGARYSWRGVCNCATRINTIGKREHEIYWYTGLDGSRVLMKWYSNAGWNAELGGYAEMLEPTVAVQQLNGLCGTEGYPFHIAGAFGKGWDNIHNYSYDLVWGLKHRTLPGTEVHLSNQVDFFEHFETEYGSGLPEVSLAFGNEWDLNLASLSEVSGQLRRSMEKLRTAEAMAALVSSDDGSPFSGLSRQKEDFLYALGVYNLHGWTADGPVERHDFATYMRRQQRNVTGYVDTLYVVALREMGNKIDPGRRTDVLFVFNAFNWTRSGHVDIPLDPSFTAVRDLRNGKTLSGEVLTNGNSRYLRVRVESVPALGYITLQLVEDANPDRGRPFRYSDGLLETPYYRARITRSGAIASLCDKGSGKEWVNGLLNNPGCGECEAGEPVRIADQGSSFITLQCQSRDPVDHESYLTFYAEDPRIDIHNIISQNYEHPLHWSFAFNVELPTVWHEEVGAIIKAKTESAGGHYADRMARYDYLTLNHFLNVGNKGESITLSSADCLFFRLGDSHPEWLDIHSSTVHVLVGGQVNDNLGIIAQDGDTLFHQHFSLLPHAHAFDPGVSMRFALDHQNPLIAGPVMPGGEWKPRAHSFLQSDNSDAILWTFKPGEEDGLTMRWWNLGQKPIVAKMQFSLPLRRAANATHVETILTDIPLSANGFTVNFNQQQLKTIRLWRQ